MKHKFNLQLLADGGASTSTGGSEAAGESSGAVTGGMRDVPGSQGENDLSNLEFGVSINSQEVANPEAGRDNTTKTQPSEAELQKTFDEMIKKGGKWHDQFDKRTQDIIDKRFHETKMLEKTLDSHSEILGLLAAKYGVDAKDSEGILKALSDDTSLFEEAAFKEGLSPEQYRNKIKLEQENARLRQAQEELKAHQGAEQIYAGWLNEAEALKAKYGLENFDFATEMENPDFTQLLSNGISFEAAYKTIHFDDMVNGAMAATASQVEKALVNNIQARSSRPAENATQSASGKIFKTDPSSLTDAELDECIRRVAGGAQISFGNTTS